jgi:signal transduction histidine kinase
MLRTLRFRLFASHILPMFLFVPLIGLLLIYLLENQVFLPMLAKEVTNEAQLIANELRGKPEAWQDHAAAEAFIRYVNLQHPLQLYLLNPAQVLLATDRQEDQKLVGSTLPGLFEHTEEDGSRWQINESEAGDLPRLDVMVAATGDGGQALGYVRLTRRLEDLEQGLGQSRLWVFGLLLAGLMVNTLIGYESADLITRRIQRIARVIKDEPLSDEPVPVPSSGYAEFDLVTQAYNRLQARRYQMELSRQRMIANVVHELGRPLGSLSTAAYALQGGAGDEPALRKDLISGMVERIKRMGVLLEDLALAYRPRERLELNRVRVDPIQWLEPLVPLWAESARQAGLDWQVDLPQGLPAIEIDSIRLDQALSNLVANAIKFTPTGGRVALRGGGSDKIIWFAVEDNGPGIPSADQMHLFEPFFRSVRPGWKVPGLGLGLSIAKTIVEAHGGAIQVDSALGQGSTFTIVLPLPVHAA